MAWHMGWVDSAWVTPHFLKQMEGRIRTHTKWQNTGTRYSIPSLKSVLSWSPELFGIIWTLENDLSCRPPERHTKLYYHSSPQLQHKPQQVSRLAAHQALSWHTDALGTYFGVLRVISMWLWVTMSCQMPQLTGLWHYCWHWCSHHLTSVIER